jgi:uncharacterized protein YeaO (DUF488 family)
MSKRNPPAISAVRVYGLGDRDVGYRVLVDRLWPRGVSKVELHLDEWMKEISPSAELREWFDHRPERWSEFRRRYARELKAHDETIERLVSLSVRRRLALLFAARDVEHNNALALQEILESRRAAQSGETK